MKVLATLLAFFLPLAAISQIMNLPGAVNEVLRTRKYADVEGSPYLSNDWLPGTLLDRNGREYNNVLLRYDSYKNNVEVSSANGILIVTADLYPAFSVQFVEKSGNLRKQSFTTNVNPQDPLQYVEVLATGTWSLFKQVKTELIEETVNSYGTSSNKQVFTAKPSYWAKIDTDTRAFKLSKSSFLEAFPAQQQALEKFQASKKAKFRTESDFISFFAAMNAK